MHAHAILYGGPLNHFSNNTLVNIIIIIIIIIIMTQHLYSAMYHRDRFKGAALSLLIMNRLFVPEHSQLPGERTPIWQPLAHIR